MNFIPAFYFPTTVSFVDDNFTFLEGLLLALSKKTYSCSLFTDPLRLKNLIKEECHIRYDIANLIEIKNPSSLNYLNIPIDLEKIINLLEEKKRYYLRGVLVVDYDMPQLNGFELLESIDPKGFFYKILLTSEADESMAINALNKGRIQAYIKKSDLNLLANLEEMIEIGQWKFFESQTQFMQDLTKVQGIDTALCFSDSIFINFFKDLIQKKEIIEWYLLDSTGSFLLVNKRGNAFVLYVQNEDQLNFFKMESEDACKGLISENQMMKIQNNEQIFCFIPREGSSLPEFEEWGSHFNESKAIECESSIFYICLQEAPAALVNKIASNFNDYATKYDDSDGFELMT